MIDLVKRLESMSRAEHDDVSVAAELDMMREAMEQALSWCEAGRPIHAARLIRAALEEARGEQ